MPFKINTVQEPLRTLTAKVFSDNTQLGADIALTESASIPGHYFSADIDTSSYGSVTVMTFIFDGSDIVGYGESKFINSVTIDEETYSKIDELYRLQGLDLSNPMTVSESSRVTTGINLSITRVGDSVTVERQ